MRYVPIHITSRPGSGPTGWYVHDTSVTSCTVTLGGPHHLRFGAKKECDKLNGPHLRSIP